MFSWFRRWQDRRLDKLCVKIVDRIEALNEAHKPVEQIQPGGFFTDDWPNRKSTFKVGDVARITMRNPGKHSPHKRKRK